MLSDYLRHRFHHEGATTEYFATLCQEFSDHGWHVRLVDPMVFTLWPIEGRTKDLALLRLPASPVDTSVWELAEITHPSNAMRVYLLHSYYDYGDRGGETIDLYGLREPAYLAMCQLGLLFHYDFETGEGGFPRCP